MQFKRLPITILCLSALASASVGFAQSYSLSWFKTAGGGGTCTNTQYSLSGTIGQADAGAMSGGPYSLSGGFWTLYAVQTPGAPKLSIATTSTNTVVVSWPSVSTGFHLEQNAQLASASWVAPAEPVLNDGTNKFIVVRLPTANRFYRLKSP
jgi:hypothetical protein